MTAVDQDPEVGTLAIEERAAQQVRNGWGPLPLPTGKKAMPPRGFTGGSAPMPSYADWYTVWSENPDQWGNLGARIPEGVVGVDVDAYDGKNGAATWGLIGGTSFPDTVLLSSRFGPGYDKASGIRLYRLPEGVDQSMLWGAHDGIEILRFGHRYAVSPGSLHPNKSYYQAFDVRARLFLDVLPPVEDLPMLTVEQARMLTNDGAPWGGDAAVSERPKDENPQCAYTSKLLNRAIGDLRNKGSRYDTMSRTVWALVNGEDEGHHLGEALTILKLAYIAAAGKDRREAGHEPPDSEFNRNVRDAYRKVAANPTDDMLKACCSTAEGGGEPPLSGFTPATPALGGDRNTRFGSNGGKESDHSERSDLPPEGRWWSQSLTLAALEVREYPPLSYLVETVLPRGGLVLLSSAPKLGKSLLALALGLAVADGAEALDGGHGGFTAQRGDVLYVSLDDTSERRVQRRVRGILKDRRFPANLSVHLVNNLGTGAQAAQGLHEYLTAFPRIRLVVIDTLEHIRGPINPGEGVYSADVRALGYLRAVLAAHPEVTLLCLTHVRKDKYGDDDAVSATTGTFGVTGGADALLRLTGLRNTPRRMLEVVSRDEEDSRHILAIGPNGLTWTGDDPDDPAAMLSPDDARLYRALKEFPDGVTAKELGDAVTVTGIGDRLRRLAKQGVISRLNRGVYRV
jgi:hypothetical protein